MATRTSHETDPSRRRLLRGLSAALAPMLLPCGFLIPKISLAAAPRWDRMLILIELQGGNDGLNTLVPFRDDAYRALRPTLGLPVDQLVMLNDTAALHNALTPMVSMWEAGEMAVVQSIGYERPNHSHFRSIEIWDAASGSDEVVPEGWVSRLFAAQRPPAETSAEGVIFGRPVLGPLLPAPAESGVPSRRFVVMDSVKNFTRRGLSLPAPAEAPAETPALQHLLSTQAVAGTVAQKVAADLKRIEGNEALEKRLAAFPQHTFGKQCAELARLLAADSKIEVAKLSHGGFDTHVNQLGTHARLLGELASGLAALRAFAKEQGVWDRLVIATYSEFGRRAGENKSAGTDHGTAAPHFVLGGKVKGGMVGTAPDLGKLQAGDLIHSLPMQRYIASLAKETWGLSQTLPALDPFEPLGLIS